MMKTFTERLSQHIKSLTGIYCLLVEYGTGWALVLIMDEVPGVKNDNMSMCNPSKYLLWQNILLGLYDSNIEGLALSEHYRKLGDLMKQAKDRNGEYGFIFELTEKLCIDFRYGALLSNINTVMTRLRDYLDNKIPEIEELDERRIAYPANSELPAIYRYKNIISASRLTQ